MDSLRAASDRVVICLEKAEADLKAVEHRLEEEFQQTYAGRGANPLSILQRLKKLERASGPQLLAARLGWPACTEVQQSADCSQEQVSAARLHRAFV
ncbi:hypothetical protein WJX75_005428 [Coccomyxa subellipsoidea]|uniref:Ska2 N-terminal domain-containing protein n=1 Tax=Coccomyxa subellipsoidea TaxID=248742 RepID=A0ABR2YCF0_9CHLO